MKRYQLTRTDCIEESVRCLKLAEKYYAYETVEATDREQAGAVNYWLQRAAVYAALAQAVPVLRS